MAAALAGTLSRVAAPMTVIRHLGLYLLLSLALPGRAVAFDHGTWNQLLQTYVHPLRAGKATRVDYTALLQDRSRLEDYLDALAQVSRPTFDGWPPENQLAFLINAYNAWTVKLISDNYPGIDSIKDLASWFTSPWERTFIPLLGKRRSLDDIEHGLIRGSGRYNDPRIHFAVNCASIGCPALRTEAYTGTHLEQQLDNATRNFLADTRRNRLRGDTLEISSIFKWYRKDFERGWRRTRSLREFLAHYAQALGLSAHQRTALVDGTLDIDFLPYDWHLNDVRR
jgi:hypothetical protein